MLLNIEAFLVAASLMTITPGIDTTLVLRTSTMEGTLRGALAGAGIIVGVLVWGLVVALGLGLLLTASAIAFDALKWAGAAYLVYLGLRLILSPRRSYDIGARGSAEAAAAATPPGRWFWRGLLSNLLNPKVGVFYVSFLPQFVPPGVQVAGFTVLLAAIHAGLNVIWFGALILATAPLARLLRRPGVVRWMDRVVGGVFVGFGIRLALSSRR